MTYRSTVDADGVYIHYDLDGDYVDQEGVATTTGTQYGGSYLPSFVSSLLAGNTGNQALYFDDSASGVYVGTVAQAQACFGTALDDNGDISIECWYKSDSSLAGGMRASGVENLIRHDGTLWWLRINNKKLQMLINTTSSTNYSHDGSTTLANDTLYHFVGTYTGGSDKKIRLYVNGVLDGTSAAASGTLTTGTNANATYLGSPGGETAKGTIDEMAIYRKVLSQAEITSHYNTGLGVTNVTIAAGTTTNVAVDAKDATVSATTGVTIAAGTTSNIAVAGQPATVDANTNVSIAAGTTTNIAIDAKDATLPNVAVVATVSNISLTGPAPTLFVGITVSASVSNVSVDAQDAIIPFVTVFAGTTQNIGISASDILELYPALVTLNNPVHYYRMIEDSPSSNIKDYGSKPIDGTSPNAVHADYGSGIAGDPTSESLEFVVGTSLSTSAVDIIKYSSPIFEVKNNLSYEFWVKTSSNDGIILAIDATNSTVSSETFRNTIAIGLTDGYLSLIKLQNAGTTTITKTNSKLNTNVWNHVVLIKETFTDYVKYSSYVNNEKTNVIISIAEFLSYTISTNRQSIGNYVDDSNVSQNDFNYTIYLDEIALYESALTQSDISNHYNTGRGSGAVSVAVTASNITVDAKDATREIIINAELADISVAARNVSLEADGDIQVEVNIGGITIDEQASTLSLTASISINAQVANSTINGNINKVSIKDVEFKFISTEDTSLGASDCETLTSFEYGGLLYLQEKKLLFRIGNLATNNCNFNISIYSNETEILDALTLSSDNITYSDTLSINGVKPNSITDPIWVKIDTNNIETLGTGTFLVDVEQIYV